MERTGAEGDGINVIQKRPCKANACKDAEGSRFPNTKSPAREKR